MPYFSRIAAAAGERRCVGRRGPRADHVQIVADHVGEQQRFHRRRGRQARQLSALDPRDVLAHRVDLVDVRAARQQQSRDGLLLFQRDRFAPAAAAAPIAPPEIRHSTRSSFSARRGDLAQSARPPPRRARRAPDGRTRSARCGAACATCPSFTLIRPPVIRRPSTRSAACAMDAPAFPAPMT